MIEVLDHDVLDQWRSNPAAFIETVLHNPETGAPFVLLDAERNFLQHAFQTDDDGRLRYPEQIYGAPKKSGKTGFAALHMLTTVLLFGGRFAEGYALANDLEQAQSRVFQAVKRIVEASPLLRAEAKVTSDRVTFPAFGNAVITAIASDYGSAAGANPVISSFDELWAYTSERSRRLWDEMVPPPTRKVSLRLTTSYAGFENESVLLLELYRRGLAQPEVAPNLHAGDGILMAWHHRPVAPWQTDAWLTSMQRSLRPSQFSRMILNEFTTTDSSFVSMTEWDACVMPGLGHMVTQTTLPVWVGVDASTKRDSTALVACTWDDANQRIRLVTHRIFQPSADNPVDFEGIVEATVLDWYRRFDVRQVLYDPYQMVASAQRLRRDGVLMEEFPQTIPNLTEMGNNLYELIKGKNLLLYPDPVIRTAISRTVAVETPRGWRLGKSQQMSRVDVVIALAMAALAAVRAQQSCYNLDAMADVTPDDELGIDAWRRLRLSMYLHSNGTIRL